MLTQANKNLYEEVYPPLERKYLNQRNERVNRMKKALKYVDEHFEEYLMGFFLIGISCVMFAQIIMRFLGSSISWAEELCRYFYVWSVFLSISFTVKKGIVLRVDLLISKLPSKAQKAIEIILQLINVAAFALLSYYSVQTVKGIKLSMQTTPAMVLPMYIIYLIIPVGFCLASIRSIQQVYLIAMDKTVKAVTDFTEA